MKTKHNLAEIVVTKDAPKTIEDKIVVLESEMGVKVNVLDLLNKIMKASNPKSRLFNEIYIMNNQVKQIEEQIRVLNSLTEPPGETPAEPSEDKPPIDDEIEAQQTTADTNNSNKKTEKEYRPKNSTSTFRKIKVEKIVFTNGDINPTAMVERMIRRAPKKFAVNDVISSLRQDGYVKGSVNSDPVAQTVYRVISSMRRNELIRPTGKTAGSYEKIATQ